MVRAMEAAYRAARKAIESTYSGVVTVTEHQKVKDPVTKLTEESDAVVLENHPCKLSFENVKAAVQSDSAAAIAQTTKLFVSPDVSIKAGSKITVTQAGVTIDYTCSGVPAVYPTHQEIVLDLFEDWA